MAEPNETLAVFSAALADTVTAAAPSVVSIRSARTRSSGFVWRPGLIVTADDALPDDGDLTVVPTIGDPLPARVAGRDPTTDTALLRIERADLPVVTMATSAVRSGEVALALGAEDGAATVALGVVARVAGPWRSLRGGEIDARIELGLDLRRSAEGGVVLNAFGQATGMPVFGPRGRVIIIPASTIDRVAQRLERDGRVARGYVGLGLQTVAVDGDKSGAMVISVDPEGPAVAAGIRQGDILLAWNGEPVPNVQSLLRALGPESVGQSVRLELSRAGDTMSLSLTVAEKPVT